MPDRAYSRVDLPAPLAPMITVKSPRYSSRSMFLSTCCMEPPLEKDLLSFSVCNRISFIMGLPSFAHPILRVEPLTVFTQSLNVS